MPRAKWMLLTLTVAAAIAAPSAADARDVKRCGITIGAGKTGRLVRDVQCGFRCTADPTVRCRTTEDDDNVCPIAGSRCSPESIRLERQRDPRAERLPLVRPVRGEGDRMQ